MRFCAITSPSHKIKFHIYFSLTHDLIAHGLSVVQINSAQVVMFSENHNFSTAHFFFQGTCICDEQKFSAAVWIPRCTIAQVSWSPA